MSPRLVALSLLVVGSVASVGCPKRNDPQTADTGAAMATTVDAAIAVTTSPAPTTPNAACAVAYASFPLGGAPVPGEDLSNAPVPLRVPENASLTIAVRRTGHEVRIKGPAVVRPCTHDEPDVVLIATGEASLDASAPVRPGAEIFLATPAFVAVLGRASLRVTASSSLSSWDVESGEVTITNLDTPKVVSGKDKGALKRFEDGGLLLTRCGVQAAAAASAERLLLGFSQGDAAPPLPSASIGILTAQQIKHARERVLDCALAESFALSCDQLAEGSGAAAPGCAGNSYVKVREHIARATASGPIPPGSPPPKVTGTAPIGTAP
jgi:hypothetical protein